jgi:predicted metal-dependent hydrolase
MVSGESHYFLGRRYRLRVVSHDGLGKVHLRNSSIIELHVSQSSDASERERILQRWYRERLKELIPPLLEKWQKALKVEVAQCRVKKMKTKWGSCNAAAGRIWLNLELAKKPVQCLEYLVVHELAHLIERRHNENFISIMNKHLPKWRLHREELNSAPLANETWSY